MTRIFRRLRILAVAVAALAMLALPAAASARRGSGHARSFHRWAKQNHVRGAGKDPDMDGLSNRAEFLAGTNPRKADSDRDGVSDANEDPDRDGVDNGNEVREHTNPRKADTNGNGRKDGLEDADRDRLDNTGEDQAGDDPINPDSDGDGVKDGDEGAGKVTSFDGSQLVVTLFTGATLSGAVDEDTEVWCDDAPSADSADFRVAADDQSSDDSGDDSSSDDSGPSCTTGDIQVGDVVSSASIDFGSDGGYFSSIELAP